MEKLNLSVPQDFNEFKKYINDIYFEPRYKVSERGGSPYLLFRYTKEKLNNIKIKFNVFENKNLELRCTEVKQNKNNSNEYRIYVNVEKSLEIKEFTELLDKRILKEITQPHYDKNGQKYFKIPNNEKSNIETGLEQSEQDITDENIAIEIKKKYRKIIQKPKLKEDNTRFDHVLPLKLKMNNGQVDEYIEVYDKKTNGMKKIKRNFTNFYEFLKDFDENGKPKVRVLNYDEIMKLRNFKIYYMECTFSMLTFGKGFAVLPELKEIVVENNDNNYSEKSSIESMFSIQKPIKENSKVNEKDSKKRSREMMENQSKGIDNSDEKVANEKPSKKEKKSEATTKDEFSFINTSENETKEDNMFY